MREKKFQVHAAAYGCALLILVSVARLPELYLPLTALALGKVALVLVAVGLATVRTGDEVAMMAMPLGRLMAVFAVLATLSVAFSVWPSKSLEFLSTAFFSNFVAFYAISRTSVSLHAIRFYVNCLVISAAILSYLTLQLEWSGRLAVSESYDPNDLAQVLITLTPLIVMRLFSDDCKTKIVQVGIIAICIVATLLTGSRGGFLGLVSIVLYFTFSRLPSSTNSRPGRFTTSKLIALALGLFVVVSIVPQGSWNRFSTLMNLESDYNMHAETGRITVWKRGISLMFSRPIGSGIAAFTAAEGSLGGRYKAAHNALIQVGVELGVLGLGVFILFYKSAFRTLRKLIDINDVLDSTTAKNSAEIHTARIYGIGLRGALIGFFVTSFFLSSAYSPVLYCLFGLIAGLGAIGQRHEDNHLIALHELTRIDDDYRDVAGTSTSFFGILGSGTVEPRY